MVQYLVVVRTARDDAPQRLFDDYVEAVEFAKDLQPEDIADPFGKLRDGTELADMPVAVVRFQNGKSPTLCWQGEREDWPSNLAYDRMKYVAAVA
jgi:hypothetical protein